MKGTVTGSARLTAVLLLCSFLTTAAFLAGLHFAGLFRFTEAGYGDSYILYDVLSFQKTGIIYRDLSIAPYLPTQYSPLVYRMYAAPGPLSNENPFFGPRLMALAAFLACIGMAASIARALIPIRGVWLWAIAVGASFRCMEMWPLQLRGDFAGTFFSLAAVRFLMARFRGSVLLAGLCAGFALQFKITFVAALAAGSLWLLFHREWKRLGVFCAAAAVSSAGLYLAFWIREPRMISQILALAPAIWDPAGSLRLLYDAAREPAVLTAFSAAPWILTRRSPRWRLLSLYGSISLAISVLTDMQAGGNVNYFFEWLFALTPFAVWGCFRLIVWSSRDAGVAAFITALILIWFWAPRVRETINRRQEFNPDVLQAQNEAFRQTADVLRSRHFFSTVPRLALLDPLPPLMEPYLFAYELELGKIDPAPILEGVGRGDYDLVITPRQPQEWRGIVHGGPALHAAIQSGYQPYCTLAGDVWWLPRFRPKDGSLTEQLRSIGCVFTALEM
jgi:hypothetical protein